MQPIRAETLEDVYKSISPKPLIDPEEFRAYYRGQINRVRGNDKVDLMALGLRRAFGGLHYKALLAGHSGVGKSTELTRLTRHVDDKFSPLRFSVISELDPTSSQPFDVLLLMMIDILKKTAAPREQGGAGRQPSEDRLKEVWDWFASETSTLKKATSIGGELSATAGIEEGSWWSKLLLLSVRIRGEIRYASVRSKEITAYRLMRISDLTDLANRLLDDCNALLKQETGKEWLIIGEDFDRMGIPLECVQGLFVTFSSILKSLRTHSIFVIPIALAYSPNVEQFHVNKESIHCLPDTPVYDKDHTPHRDGRKALRVLLDARMSLDLFVRGQLERVIVASGGNIRDLFSLVSKPADLAVIEKDDRIRTWHVNSAITELRTDYERRLGESPFEIPAVTYQQKAERLVRVYNQEPAADVPDSVLYSLLRSRAVQEFNCARWFGVHPLIVDILKMHGHLEPNPDGTIPGGTI